MNTDRSSSQRRIFRRTLDGQKAALFAKALLSPTEMRLLLIVNGCTPLEDLISLAPALNDEASVKRLLNDGLIEAAGSPIPPRKPLMPLMGFSARAS